MRGGDLAESLIFLPRPFTLFWREFAPVFQSLVQTLLLLWSELRVVFSEL